MRVWIDQDLCTGDGLCLDHCPDVFVQLEDGIAYVAESGSALNDPGGSGSLAAVPRRHVQAVINAAEGCPGECIFIEVEAPAAAQVRSHQGRHFPPRATARHASRVDGQPGEDQQPQRRQAG